MATTHEEAAKVKDEANEKFPFLFFTFLLLLPQEIVLEQEHTMADEEHFFLPTSQSEYAWVMIMMMIKRMMIMMMLMMRMISLTDGNVRIFAEETGDDTG